MNPKSITSTIEKQRWLDVPSRALDKAVGSIYDSRPGGKKAMSVLHGDWLGHPLHPAMIDVPIGAFFMTVTLDTIDAARKSEDLNAGADIALGVGIVTALAAAAAGWTDWHMIRDASIKRTGLVHATINVSALTFLAASFIQRRRKRRKSGRILALLGYAVLIGGAYIGGSMVYNLRAGVGDV